MKSQWEFGELFPSQPARRLFSVSELTAQVRSVLEAEVGRVWVTGEISNLRCQSSGHFYFCIKDTGAQLSCVLFRNEARTVPREALKDGQKVVLQGEVTVYEARGQYQLRVLTVELEGLGALQAAFERLKQRLQAEGMFAQERKRLLPRFPRRAGLVTSASGAALRDVAHVVRRRFAGLELVLATCRVQGQGAAEEIACAIDLLNRWSLGEGQALDLILVTRGGGSLEDLWAFNEETVARAIFRSNLPVVSAVGHEIDFTIADFVADVRAATPSAAAEIITEGYMASRAFVRDARAKLRQSARDRIALEMRRLRECARALARCHPRRRLQDHWQRLDDLIAAMRRCLRVGVRQWTVRFEAAVARLQRSKPAQSLTRRRERVERLAMILERLARARLLEKQAEARTLVEKLRLLSPRNVLERGYSITMRADSGAVVTDAEEVAAGERLRTVLKVGTLESVVEEKPPTQTPAP